MKSELATMIGAAHRVALIGHIRPDGDCIGACLGLQRYLELVYPDLETAVYLEEFSGKFDFLCGSSVVKHEVCGTEAYDLAICLDCSDRERMGFAEPVFLTAKHTICIDRHATNRRFGEFCLVNAAASSTCEYLCDLLDPERMDTACAECLYTGIVHDTGVFKHSNTTRHTMETAGLLIEKGLLPEHIINDSFYKKTFVQSSQYHRNS